MSTPSPLPYDIGAYGPGKIVRNADPATLMAAYAPGVREFCVFAMAPDTLGPLVALRELPEIQGLQIHARRKLGDVDWHVLRPLSCLRYLQHWHERATGALDLADYPALEWLVMPWWEGLRFSRAALRGLRLTGWNGRVLHIVSNRLESLALVQPTFDTLRPIEELHGLRSLTLIGMRGLRSLEGLGALPLLEELCVQSSPHLADCSAVQACPSLRRLRLEDCPRVERMPPLDAQQVFSVGSTPTWNVPRAAEAPRLPSFEFAEPAIRTHRELLAASAGSGLRFPDWFRASHPDLCGSS